MKTTEKSDFILSKLEELYPNPAIPLDHIDDFTMLIAVLLSAQCTDKRVNIVTADLFPEASSPKAMRKIGRERIKEIIRPCGLSPQKSKAIYELSGILLEKFDGKVPGNFVDLESLPGVGHKTASVVMSQVFNEAAFPVDTHIHRLAYRWKLSSGKNVVQSEKDLKRLFPKESWNKLHLQIIYFGREYCPARGHNKDTCPICSVIGRKNMKR